MLNTAIQQEIITELAKLPVEQQRKVLQYTRTLASGESAGVPGKSLLRFAGTIEPDDLAMMARAIEEGCEQVNLDEW